MKQGEDEQREVARPSMRSPARPARRGRVAFAATTAMSRPCTRWREGVFFNPALTEPYGLTLIEAASHGLPVIATCNGGPSDIVAEPEHASRAARSRRHAAGDAAHAGRRGAGGAVRPMR